MTALAEHHPAVGLRQVLRPDGTADPQRDPFLPSATLLSMYRSMVRIRRVDERMLAKQRQGKVGFYGAITGQEATPVATAFATRPSDWAFPALRESALMVCRGFPLSTWLAQVYGNERDILLGRQMPSHMSGRAAATVSWSSCIANQLPQAVGAAYAAKLRGHDDIALGFMGDGATSEPDFHAALTFASRWKAPVVFVCQNNHWAISVPAGKQSASRTFAAKALAYGMPGVRVDGNDVLAVYGALTEAVERARGGAGPTLLECLTYRMGPHSSSDDPNRYRDAAEVTAWAEKDPLRRFERYLSESKVLDDAQAERILDSVEAELAAAIEEVESLPGPARSTLFDDVYASSPATLEEQRATLLNRTP